MPNNPLLLYYFSKTFYNLILYLISNLPINALENKYPELREIIEAGVSVSVDGRIIASGLTEPVYENSEVFLLQQLKGG